MQVSYTICNMIKSLYHSLTVTFKHNIIETELRDPLNSTV